MTLPEPLTEEENIYLLSQNTEEAKKQLMERNLCLIHKVIKDHFSYTPFEYDDLFQIGSFGLMKAVNKFSFDKKTRFASFACSSIQNEIVNFMIWDGKYAKYETNCEAETLQSYVEQENNLGISPEEIYIEKEIIYDLKNCIGQFSENRQYMLLMHLGFNTERKAYTVRELASIIGCHHSYVHKCIKQMLEEMRINIGISEETIHRKHPKRKIA